MMNGASPMWLHQGSAVRNPIKKTVLLTLLFVLTVASHAQSVNFTSSNLPIVVINTNGQTIPDDPKIVANMGIIYNGVGVRNNVTDPYNHYNGKIGIEIRGQSSQQFPMKSYSVELRNAAGTNSINQSILGMPSESDWVFYAPYTDKTLMRNALAYQMSRELGHWAANCRHVELVLNGDYRGVYILMERIKRKNSRVNIASLSATDVQAPNVTGGYIFSIDKEPNGWFSAYNTLSNNAGQKIQFSYIYPKIENIVQAQKDYLKSYVDSFEKALDQKTDFTKYANMNTFIDFMLVNEVSRNVDGYRLSSYFHKDRLGKINAGPVWDYDLAFRNANYCNGALTTGWAYKFDEVCPTDYFAMPFWWKSLMSYPSYRSALRCRYKDVRKQQLSQTRLYQFIDSVSGLLNEAQQRHFTRWPVLGQYVWPNPQPIPTSYSGEILALKNWLADRLQWLDNNMPNEGACFDFPPQEQRNIIVTLLNNPTNGVMKLKVQSKNAGSIQISVHTVGGQLLQKTTQNISAGESIYSIPIQNINVLKSLRVYHNGKNVFTQKIL